MSDLELKLKEIQLELERAKALNWFATDKTTDSVASVIDSANSILTNLGYQTRAALIKEDNTFEEEYEPAIIEGILTGTEEWCESTKEFIYPARGKNELIGILDFPKNEKCVVATLNVIDKNLKTGETLTEKERDFLKIFASMFGKEINNRLVYDTDIQRKGKYRAIRHDAGNKIVGGQGALLQGLRKYEEGRLTIDDAAERMRRVNGCFNELAELYDITYLTKINPKTLDEISGELPVRDFVKRLILHNDEIIDNNNYCVILSYDKDLNTVVMPGGLLGKIVDIYGGNALKYTKQKGKVLVGVYLQDHKYHSGIIVPSVHFDFVNESTKIYSEEELNQVLEEGKRFIEKTNANIGTNEGIGIQSSKLLIEGGKGEVILESGNRKIIRKATNLLKKEFLVYGKGFEKLPDSLTPYFRAEIIYPLNGKSQ